MKRSFLKKNYKEKEREYSMEDLFSLYRRLWNKLGTNKFCSICNTPIYGDIKTIYFDHLIEKNGRPDLALMEWNIAFCCENCHYKKNTGFALEKHKELINEAIKRDNEEKEIKSIEEIG